MCVCVGVWGCVCVCEGTVKKPLLIEPLCQLLMTGLSPQSVAKATDEVDNN